jgi:hypothetical protein
MSVLLSGLEKAEYFTTVGADGNIISTGKLDPGLWLHNASNPTCIHHQNENDHLGAINAVGTVSAPLPPEGTELNAGMVYEWSGQNVIVRQDHTRTFHDPDTVPALFMVYRADYAGMEWIANEQVSIGDERAYADITYIAIQQHVTEETWPPPLVPALWNVKPSETGEWQVGVAYATDDEVTHLGISYLCVQGHTSQAGWEPPAVPALWTAI